jgi:formamidopyrimidine-DNA glycosylase
MPELPDVEEFRQYVESKALHRPIQTVEVWAPEMLNEVSPRRLCARLKGEQFERTDRHGKFLFMGLSNGYWLVFHFGMTGNLTYYHGKENAPSHSRFRITFKNGYHLAYISLRKLGMIGLIKDPSAFVFRKKLGLDALSPELNSPFLQSQFRNKRTKLKSALMNQRILAGIGNLYADEIMFQVGLHPVKSVGQLNGRDLSALVRTIRRVLRMAIDRHADPDTFPRSWLLPSRYPGGSCPKCRNRLAQTKIPDRTTYFCPTCQSPQI